MTINSTYAILARLFGFALAANFFLTNAFAGVTKLSAEPLASSITTDNRPNVMFVLDDSGSMYQDFLPDWAGPISSVSAERFFNAAFNGLAYNPGSQYKPPAMFTAAGALDTTRYPSQTGMDSDGGADSSAKPNWKAVKEDGYGVQSTALGDLTTGAFYYTTVPGEYCDSAQLRNCVASTVPTGSYTFPAKLRWCTTAAKATGTTADSNGYCQAANINTTATGVTNYTYARMPSQRKATLNFSGAGTVSSITVGGVEILSASASGGTSTDLATAIANNIKACTYARVGACATATGYKATSSANVVTIYAPVATNATPVVTGASPTITAFAVGGTPGDVLLTVINPDVTSYAYPGSAAKHIKRTDCAGTTCTYAEEMTNFANWYAYYHTRMQAMKTASSLAFSTVSDRYRVGYYSINPTGSFLNLGIFSDSQKYNWYQKLLSADVDPSAAGTPLRIGLANVGRMYAGKLTTLNGETVNDPVQYSCQRNYTILSTDGYWNDSSLPVKIDGSSAIGQQDGNDLRPYYDGASQTKTVSQTEEIKQQVLKNSFLVESRTQQQQTTSRQLDQSVVTTMTYPWTESYSYLQTRSTPLEKSTYNLISKTYPLTSTTKQLRETIYKITATPRILESYTLDYLKTTIPLQQDEYMIKKTSTVL